MPDPSEAGAGRVWLWWSTGKDSAWALHELRRNPAFRVERLVTTVTPTFGRVAIHGTRIDVLEAQAAAAGLPVERIGLPFPCSNDEYEAAVGPVLLAGEAAGVGHMAFGDLFLEDVRAYRERLLEGSSIEPLFPVWGRSTHALAATMIDAGLEARVTSLDPNVLSRDLAGARYDRAFVRGLPDGVDPCGENGEFHTCVTAGPMLSTQIAVRVGEIVERSGFVYADLVRTGEANP